MTAGLSLPARADGRPPVLALFGAHCDDIEIGAGALLLQLADRYPGLVVDVTILASDQERANESRAALPTFLPGADVSIDIHELPDGRLPSRWDEAKEIVEAARARVRELGDADLVLAPSADDAHQDHRLLGELVPTAFRGPLTLHYEILKWDGDVGRPSVYVPATQQLAVHKWDLLYAHYVSQRSRGWFDREAMLGLMRVRGVECQARYAEAFYCTKMVLDVGRAVACGCC